MAEESYFGSLLIEQDLTESELQLIHSLANKAKQTISKLGGNPRFYIAGSIAKGTVIRAHYDLDLVVYWPSSITTTLEEIFNLVGDIVRDQLWETAHPKTVSWEITFKGGFHIDIVPGRAIDHTFHDAFLYRNDAGERLKTSIKKHIDTVRNSWYQDIIRLMKLWKYRKKVPIKTFLLELLAIEGCDGIHTEDTEALLNAAFGYISDKIMTARVVDPANTNNIISDDLTRETKKKIQTASDNVLLAESWGDVFE